MIANHYKLPNVARSGIFTCKL